MTELTEQAITEAIRSISFRTIRPTYMIVTEREYRAWHRYHMHKRAYRRWLGKRKAALR